MSKKAIILLNLGGPADLNGVEPFLANLFSDVISFPWGQLGSKTLGRFIARLRKEHSRNLYRDIGGGSPILKETEAQAVALQATLGDGYHVQVAMRYSPPAIEAVQATLLQTIEEWEEIIVLPLFPQYSFATTHTCYQAWSQNRALSDRATFIKSYHSHPGYIAAVRELIGATLNADGGGEGCHLLFSAHSVPESYIRQGDVYQAHIKETVGLVMEGLPNSYSLAYQSKVGPVKWLGPSTKDQIEALGHSGVTTLAVVPITFVCEHLETLHELDIIMSELARNAGIVNYLRVPAVGTHPKFIKALADISNNAERYTL
ncbi:MAG: ferrochelatase [Candidatus Neomarinimicrobiota bacterium]